MDELNGMNNFDGNNEPVDEVSNTVIDEVSSSTDETSAAPDYNQAGGNNYTQQPFTPDSTPYQQFDPMGGQQPQGGSGMSVASMVLGIVAILGACCCTYVGIICGIIAVVLGILSKKQNREGGGMALAGIICGAIGAVIGLITTIVNLVNIANGNNPLQDILDSMGTVVSFIVK